MTAKIYAEGGGEGQLLDTLFRQAWTEFFKSAGLAGRMPRIVRGKGRLRQYFGASFREEHLRPWPSLEAVPKADVLGALAKATAGCTKPYSKGKVSFELLGHLDPALVEAMCPHAKRLLDRLRQL